MINKFEDILAWQKSRILVLRIYELMKINKDYSFKDQILRAAISIMNNIAEGFEKMTKKDFVKFLYISKGSCGEVRSMLYLAKDLKYISELKFNELYIETIEISRILAGLIRSMK